MSDFRRIEAQRRIQMNILNSKLIGMQNARENFNLLQRLRSLHRIKINSLQLEIKPPDTSSIINSSTNNLNTNINLDPYIIYHMPEINYQPNINGGSNAKSK